MKIYSGTVATGSPVQTLATTRASDGSWFVDATADLAQGTYTVQGEQIDAAGNLGKSTPRTFSVDLTDPQTSITAAPSGPTSSTDAIIRFQSNEAGSSFECSIDGGAFQSCSSPYTYTETLTTKKKREPGNFLARVFSRGCSLSRTRNAAQTASRVLPCFAERRCVPVKLPNPPGRSPRK